MRRFLIGALALAPLLSACSMLPYGPQVQAIADQAAITAVEDRKRFNDNKLTVSLAALCDNSLGAVMRLEDAAVKNGLMQLCGGDGQGITADRLADLMTALDQLKARP